MYPNIMRIKSVNTFPVASALSVNARLQSIVTQLEQVANLASGVSANLTESIKGRTGRNAQENIEELARTIHRHSETIGKIIVARQLVISTAQAAMSAEVQVNAQVTQAEAVRNMDLARAYSSSYPPTVAALVALAWQKYHATMTQIDAYAAAQMTSAGSGTRSAIGKLPQVTNGGNGVAESGNTQRVWANRVADILKSVGSSVLRKGKQTSVSSKIPGLGYDPSRSGRSATAWTTKAIDPRLRSSSRGEPRKVAYGGFGLQGNKFSWSGGASSASRLTGFGADGQGSHFLNPTVASVGLGSLAAAGGVAAYRSMASSGNSVAGVSGAASARGAGTVRGAITPTHSASAGSGTSARGASGIARQAAAVSQSPARGATTAARSTASSTRGGSQGIARGATTATGRQAALANRSAAGSRGAAGRGADSRLGRFGSRQKDEENKEKLGVEMTPVDELVEGTEVTFIAAGGRW